MIDQRVLTSNRRLLRGSISHLIYSHLNEMHLLSGRKQSVGEELPIVLEQTATPQEESDQSPLTLLFV